MSKFRLEKPFFYKGHMCYNIKNKEGKYETVRADKIVWVTFVDSNLDVHDDNWDLEHIDGNWKNCSLENLKLKNSTNI